MFRPILFLACFFLLSSDITTSATRASLRTELSDIQASLQNRERIVLNLSNLVLETSPPVLEPVELPSIGLKTAEETQRETLCVMPIAVYSFYFQSHRLGLLRRTVSPPSHSTILDAVFSLLPWVSLRSTSLSANLFPPTRCTVIAAISRMEESASPISGISLEFLWFKS